MEMRQPGLSGPGFALQHLPERRDLCEQAIDLRFDLRGALTPLGEFGRVLDYLREAETLAETLDDQQRLGRVSAYRGYLTVSQSQQSAELLCPFRQTLLTDAHHDCTVMGHRGHAQLYHSPWMTFVTHLASAARQQTGDMAFHHWTAIATRTGQVDLMRRALTV